MILTLQICTSFPVRVSPILPLPDTANLGPDWAIWTAGIAASSVYMLRYDPISDTADQGVQIYLLRKTHTTIQVCNTKGAITPLLFNSFDTPKPCPPPRRTSVN